MNTLLKVYNHFGHRAFPVSKLNYKLMQAAVKANIIKPSTSEAFYIEFTKEGLAKYASKALIQQYGKNATILLVYKTVSTRYNWVYRECRFFISGDDITIFIKEIMPDYKEAKNGNPKYNRAASQVAHEVSQKTGLKVSVWEF